MLSIPLLAIIRFPQGKVEPVLSLAIFEANFEQQPYFVDYAAYTPAAYC